MRTRWLIPVGDYEQCGAVLVIAGDSYSCELPDFHDDTHWNGRIQGTWGEL